MNIFLKNLKARQELDIPLIGTWSRTYGFDHNLSFQKLAQAPDKHGAIIVKDTKIFLGADDEFAHLSLEVAIEQQNRWFKKQGVTERVVPPEHFALIEFVPYNTKINKHDKLSKASTNNLEKYSSYREQGIAQSGKKIKVIRVDGTCRHITDRKNESWKKGDPTDEEFLYKKGNKVTIQTGQYFVKDHLENSKKEGFDGIWIIASQYCQRSFTVGNIYIVMLSYDAGDGGRTNQCISRLASPFAGKNAGLVISNSFNSTRDEKIDLMLNKMIISRQKKTGLSFFDAGREVKRGFSIFSLNDNGTAIQWEMDEYLYRLATQKTSLEALTVREITSSVLNAGLTEDFKNAVGKKFKGSQKLDKTFLPDEEDNSGSSNSNNTSVSPKEENSVKNAVQNLVENAHIIQAMGARGKGRISIKSSVKNIVDYIDLTNEFMLQFNLNPSCLYELLIKETRVEQALETMVGLNVNSTTKRKDDKLKEMVWDE